MLGKIKDVFNNAKEAKPCEANAWWRSASEFTYGKTISDYNDVILNNLDGVLEKTIYDFAQTTSVGKWLSNSIQSDIVNVCAVENLTEIEGAIGIYNFDKKRISVDAKMIEIKAYKDFFENPSVSIENKESFIKDLQIKNGSDYSSDDLMHLIDLNAIELHSTIAHETTHAKDFTKIPVNQLNPKSFYLFVLSTEIHAHINQFVDTLERGKDVWNAVSDFEKKAELERYLKLNNIELGNEIPGIYRQKINEILIDSWLYDTEGVDEALLPIYQLETLRILHSRGCNHSGKNMSLPKMFKTLEIDVSPYFLMKIEREVLTPKTKLIASGFKLFNDNRKPIEKIFDYFKSCQLQRS